MASYTPDCAKCYHDNTNSFCFHRSSSKANKCITLEQRWCRAFMGKQPSYQQPYLRCYAHLQCRGEDDARQSTTQRCTTQFYNVTCNRWWKFMTAFCNVHWQLSQNFQAIDRFISSFSRIWLAYCGSANVSLVNCRLQRNPTPRRRVYVLQSNFTANASHRRIYRPNYVQWKCCV